jgi:hypothetical protein
MDFRGAHVWNLIMLLLFFNYFIWYDIPKVEMIFNTYNFTNVFLFIGNDHKYVINLKDEKKKFKWKMTRNMKRTIFF